MVNATVVEFVDTYGLDPYILKGCRSSNLLSRTMITEQELDRMYSADKDYLHQQLKALVNKVVEECAKVADNYSQGYEMFRTAEGLTWCASCGKYTEDLADKIGWAIREHKVK